MSQPAAKASTEPHVTSLDIFLFNQLVLADIAARLLQHMHSLHSPLYCPGGRGGFLGGFSASVKILIAFHGYPPFYSRLTLLYKHTASTSSVKDSKKGGKTFQRLPSLISLLSESKIHNRLYRWIAANQTN